MACLYHTDDDGPEEYYLTPFTPCPPVVLPKDGSHAPCPCVGCDGLLSVSEGRNVLDTLEFLACDACGHACVAWDKDQA